MPKSNSHHDKTAFLKLLNPRKTAKTSRDDRGFETNSGVLIAYDYDNPPKPGRRGLLERLKHDSFSRSDDSVGFESVHLDMPPSVDNKPVNHDLEEIKEDYNLLKKMAKSRFNKAKEFMRLGSKAEAPADRAASREHTPHHHKQANGFQR